MKMKLGVMFGGASVEHEISIISAMQVIAHLNKEKYDVLAIYIAKDKKMYCDDSLLKLDEYKDLKKLCKRLNSVSIFARDQKYWIRENTRFFAKEKEVDFILPIMHGTNGEDGSIQGYLKTLGIPYGGSDVLGAAIGQDKVTMKKILSFHQLPICPWFSLHVKQVRDEHVYEQARTLGYPLILKPSNLGSSVGIQVVQDEEELKNALETVFQYDEFVVIEKVIEHLREFNCSILGDHEGVKTSSIEEVLKADTILSYHDKYEGNSKSKGMASTSRILPAQISETQQQIVEQLCIDTFHALSASGVVRIDLLMDVDTQQFYVNEINTIPGSLSFYLWKDKGVYFNQLLDSLIQIGLKRQRIQENMIYSYTSNVLSSYQGGSKFCKL